MTDPTRHAAPNGHLIDTLTRIGRAALPEGIAPSVTISPPPRYDPTPDLVAASLAAGMIAAGGREVTAGEAVVVWHEIRRQIARGISS